MSRKLDDMPETRSSVGTRCYLITVLYNSEDCILPFLSSVTMQDFVEWHLIVIDNASYDTSAKIVGAMSDDRISLIRNATNLGFAKAANQGLRAALAEGAEFMILINNDTQLPPDFLTGLLSARDELHADVIVPRIMHLDRPDEAWYAGGHLHYDWVFKNVHEPFDPSDSRRVRTVDFASGCCLALSQSVVSRVGLFDESFFVYWEDTDYCIRMKHLGVPIFYVSSLVIMHEGGHASGGENTVRFNRLYWCSYVQMVRKHFGLIVAIRTVMRILLKELERPKKQWAPLKSMLFAMVKGLTISLVPPVRT